MERFLNSGANPFSQFHNKDSPRNVSLCIGLLTFKREGDLVSSEIYLTRTLASLVRALQHQHGASIFGNIRVVVFNTNLDINSHPELKRYQNILDIVQLPKYSNNFRINQRNHYASALEYCYNESDSPLILPLQDDAQASKHLLVTLQSAVNDINKLDPKWASLKLFRSERYEGFGTNHIFLLILWCCFLGVIAGVVSRLLFIIKIFKRRILNRRKVMNSVNSKETLFSICYFIIVILCSVLIIGRQNIFPVATHYGVFLDDQAMSTVALVYPRWVISEIVHHLRSREDDFPDDLSIYQYLNSEKGYNRYWVMPSLFQHLGRFSSALIDKKTPGEFSQAGTFTDEYVAF